MALCELFDLEELRLLENTLEDLGNDMFLAQMLSGSEQVRLLISNDETPLAMAREDGGWKAVSFLWKEPSDELIELLPELDIKVYTCDTETYREAVYDHFARKIMNEVEPALDDVPEDRTKKVSDLIWKEWNFKPGDLCYDCCCGSGVGSMALTKVGLRAFAFDVDAPLLSRGLQIGRLQSWSTAQLDAAKVSQYLEKAPFALMLMAGDINVGNSWIWKIIFEQVLLIGEQVMVTVGTQEEAEQLRSWAEAKGRSPRVFENERDPFYDRWVCSVR
ncbi:MAG TPA: hypothetical protein PLC39_06660 [Methanomassiliicoccales archaeon]|nr:hypothetical protein [Methanomassiliicoccales archaeon]HPR98960.1 hypothetical protein [Methanomassiliicoccales archaeon]